MSTTHGNPLPVAKYKIRFRWLDRSPKVILASAGAENAITAAIRAAGKIVMICRYGANAQIVIAIFHMIRRTISVVPT